MDKSITDDFSYEGFSNEPECYEVESPTNGVESDTVSNDSINELITMLEAEKNKTFEKIKFYSSEEIEVINEAIEVIKDKNCKWDSNIKLWNEMNSSVKMLSEIFNRSQKKNSTIGNRRIFTNININIKQIFYGIKSLKRSCDEIENGF